jgi:alkanesulfonate monooxygenase SsuD/methylene tetrahydromethanopterin reductase-like flavin-dependent oxidoreductase (luciferase family)
MSSPLASVVTGRHVPAASGIGIAFTPFETRTDVILRLASRADQLGLDRVDVAEAWTDDAFVLLAQIAARTSRIGLGASVVSTWGRTPATIAMAASGLQRCSGNRFALGIGAGSPPLTEGLHGIAWAPPAQRLRATLTAVRALLAGERLPAPAAGARPLRLGAVPESPVPIGLAALSPASIRLAGELADAWAPFLWARSRLPQGRALLAEGAARAATPTATRTAVAVPIALGADERAARRLASWWLATYATRMGPLYPRMLAGRFGQAAAVDAIVREAADGRTDLPAVAEGLAGDVTLMAAYDGAHAAVDAWFAAGADTVHLVLPPGLRELELTELLEVVADVAAARRDRARQAPRAA